MALTQVVETTVRALWFTLTSKHASGEFVGSLEWEHTGSVGEMARCVFLRDEGKQFTVISKGWQSNPWNGGMRQGFSGGLHGERLASNVVGEFSSGVLLCQVSEGIESVACVFDGLKDFVDLSVQILCDLACTSVFGV